MPPGRDIRGAVVVITGASSGIGRATALAFAGLGARLVLAARDPGALGEVERACRARDAQVLVVPTDITDAAAVERLARRAVERFGHVDVWVQAAATLIAGPLGTEPVGDRRVAARAGAQPAGAAVLDDQVRHPRPGPQPAPGGRRPARDQRRPGPARAGGHAGVPAGRQPHRPPAAGHPARLRPRTGRRRHRRLARRPAARPPPGPSPTCCWPPTGWRRG
jgi:uncharacterized membrane protein